MQNEHNLKKSKNNLKKSKKKAFRRSLKVKKYVLFDEKTKNYFSQVDEEILLRYMNKKDKIKDSSRNHFYTPHKLHATVLELKKVKEIIKEIGFTGAWSPIIVLVPLN